MNTYAEIMRDIEIPAHLEASAEVPVIAGRPQRQGDVFVVPVKAGRVEGLKPIPAEGIAVVRGESGGNTHLLVSEGPCSYAPNIQRDAVQGTLVVKEGGVAYLTHPEHGAQGIGTGSYIIRRQREQAEEIKLVAD